MRRASKSFASSVVRTPAGEETVSIARPSPFRSRRSASSTSRWSSATRTRSGEAASAVFTDLFQSTTALVRAERGERIAVRRPPGGRPGGERACRHEHANDGRVEPGAPREAGSESAGEKRPRDLDGGDSKEPP